MKLRFSVRAAKKQALEREGIGVETFVIDPERSNALKRALVLLMLWDIATR
jgi:hypothetical protein